jgi:hypothetical protein
VNKDGHPFLFKTPKNSLSPLLKVCKVSRLFSTLGAFFLLLPLFHCHYTRSLRRAQRYKINKMNMTMTAALMVPVVASHPASLRSKRGSTAAHPHRRGNTLKPLGRSPILTARSQSCRGPSPAAAAADGSPPPAADPIMLWDEASRKFVPGEATTRADDACLQGLTVSPQARLAPFHSRYLAVKNTSKSL